MASRFLDPPPRNFTAIEPGELSREEMLDAVIHGRPGSAMQPFGNVLDADEIGVVVDFVLRAFIDNKQANTRYHTPENGWYEHERYVDAFPFALGEIALDTPDQDLTPSERGGKRLFMSSCITCHDRSRLIDDRTLWVPRAVSFPRGGYSHRDQQRTDTESGATPYSRHERPPVLPDATPKEQQGETLFQGNCAFCHAPDGSGRNWIGSFLDPSPRNLTDPHAMRNMSPSRLRAAISEGVPGTSMSAWKTVLSPEQIDAVATYVEKVFINRDDASRPDE